MDFDFDLYDRPKKEKDDNKSQEEAEAAAEAKFEAFEAAKKAEVAGPYNRNSAALLSLVTPQSQMVSSVVYKINTHGWTITHDKDGNPLYYTVPEGKRACIFSSVIGGLTSINEPVVVKMLSDEVDKFIAEFPRKIVGEELNNYIRQFQYETVSKIAKLMIPELIYLIEYYFGLFEWYEKNPPKKNDSVAKADYEETKKMLYDLYNYSQEIISRPENFMTCAVYNAGDRIKEKNYQTDTMLLNNAINQEDWNISKSNGPEVLSATLKPSQASAVKITEPKFMFPKKLDTHEFGKVTSRGRKKIVDTNTTQMLQNAFEENSLALIFDNSCFEILGPDKRLIQNFKTIEDLRQQMIQQNANSDSDNQIQMTLEKSDEIKAAISEIKGISRLIGDKMDDSLIETNLPDQIAKLQGNSVFMQYYQKVTTEPVVEISAATSGARKKGGKRKTLKKYRNKMSQKKRYLSKNKRRKTKRK